MTFLKWVLSFGVLVGVGMALASGYLLVEGLGRNDLFAWDRVYYLRPRIFALMGSSLITLLLATFLRFLEGVSVGR